MVWSIVQLENLLFLLLPELLCRPRLYSSPDEYDSLMLVSFADLSSSGGLTVQFLMDFFFEMEPREPSSPLPCIEASDFARLPRFLASSWFCSSIRRFISSFN
ncbi:unnamed protein product [Pseudo-nitzschia multistriata]|uniref:Secreted protein n=1 Tax=Pseudo-nitzschia multistriata TaxID=183589 RepID=A0A448Z497_9STRA|nr:unnamed protein product [Pseudo-nitzschia multistriata]